MVIRSDPMRSACFLAEMLGCPEPVRFWKFADDAEGGPLSVFESGAVLTYLADKYGRFLAPSGHARWKAQEWLYWQNGRLGPMMGQVGFFAFYAKEKVPLAINRYVAEVGRLFKVIEGRLAGSPYLAGDAFSVADIACYPWMVGAKTRAKEVVGQHLADKPAIDRWMRQVAARPGVERGMAIEPPPTSSESGARSNGERSR